MEKKEEGSETVDNYIVNEAGEYKKLAEMIKTAAQNASSDQESSFIDDALLRLFYIKSVESKLEKSMQQLTEETEPEVYSAVYEAGDAIQDVTDIVFEQIEDYVSKNRKFEIEIENTSADLESGEQKKLLNQLYKCEGIIRLAQRTANRYTIYGNSSKGWERLEGIDEAAYKSQEDKIYDDLGIDVYELFDIREKLIVSLEKLVGKTL